MIDLHCHILPGIDDGPEEFEESVTMAKIAVSDGITTIFATPHYHAGDDFLEDRDRAILFLSRQAAGEEIGIRFLGGADIAFSFELVAEAEQRRLPTLGGTRYFLLELPAFVPPHMDQFLFAIEALGYKAIITHPERNATLLAEPQRLEGLRNSGALFQLTAMSITGGFGPEAQMFSQMLLRRGFADFVATDAHRSQKRKPALAAALAEVERMSGKEYAGRIFFENPEIVLADRAWGGS